MESRDFNDDNFTWNFSTIFNYIKVNYLQFLLLMGVFIIIYIVDYISYINAMKVTIPASITKKSQIKNKKAKSKK